VLNGSPVPVSSLVDRARAMQRAIANRTTEVVEQVETSGRLAVVFHAVSTPAS
jgi:hypothetical protein